VTFGSGYKSVLMPIRYPATIEKQQAKQEREAGMAFLHRPLGNFGDASIQQFPCPPELAGTNRCPAQQRSGNRSVL